MAFKQNVSPLIGKLIISKEGKTSLGLKRGKSDAGCVFDNKGLNSL